MKKINFNLEVILGILILIISFILIFNLFNKIKTTSSSNNNLIIYADFFDIGNLSLGNDIKINGVKAGEVSNIKLDEESFAARVTFVFNNTYKIPIDSTATISSDGLIGGSYVNFIPGSDKIYLQNNDFIEDTVDAISLENIISDIIFSN